MSVSVRPNHLIADGYLIRAVFCLLEWENETVCKAAPAITFRLTGTCSVQKSPDLSCERQCDGDILAAGFAAGSEFRDFVCPYCDSWSGILQAQLK